MTGKEYVNQIISKYKLNEHLTIEELLVKMEIEALLKAKANGCINEIYVSGSRAKGTALTFNSDFDLFVSLTATNTLEELYNWVYEVLMPKFSGVRKQNVSIGLKSGNLSIDVVPAKKDIGHTNDHKLYKNKSSSWTLTNVKKHIDIVKNSNRISEIMAIKIWKELHGLDFPSIYLESTVINALKYKTIGDLDNNVLAVLDYLRDSFETAAVYDPANTNNKISDDLTATERKKIADKAKESRSKQSWGEIIW